MEKGLHLYVDFMSQPSRAVVIFCRVNKIQTEGHIVSLAKGEHRQPEFKSINPMGQVPAINDGGFKLFESHAILRYLAVSRFGIPDHWYPADASRRAKVDCILDWHHANLRRGATQLVFHQVLAPSLGASKDPAAASEGRKLLIFSLSKLESIWLSGKGSFLGGALQPSIADLSLACEIKQLELLGADEMSKLLTERIRNWLSSVQSALSPHFAEVHSILYKVVSRYQKESKGGVEAIAKLQSKI